RTGGGDRGADAVRRRGRALVGHGRGAGARGPTPPVAPDPRRRPVSPDEPAGEASEQGRVVLVTGGNRGIGLACVEWFLAHGDRVAATYRREPPPPVPGAEDRHLAVRCDVTDP